MKYALLFAYISLLALPTSAGALAVYAEKPASSPRVGDTVLIPVYIDTEGEELNSVEGQFSVKGNAEIVGVSTGGSVLGLWPEKPSLSKGLISFTGGSSSGFSGSRLKLFTLFVKVSGGDNILMYSPVSAGYVTDGSGAQVSGKTRPVALSVLPNDGNPNESVSGAIAADTTPPEHFSIERGRDPGVYGGAEFLSFYANDAVSGISHYEVSEPGYDPVRTGSTYMIRNPEGKGSITVKAYDVAGNVRTETVRLSENSAGSVILRILVVLVGAALFIAVRSLIARRMRS